MPFVLACHQKKHSINLPIKCHSVYKRQNAGPRSKREGVMKCCRAAVTGTRSHCHCSIPASSLILAVLCIFKTAFSAVGNHLEQQVLLGGRIPEHGRCTGVVPQVSHRLWLESCSGLLCVYAEAVATDTNNPLNLIRKIMLSVIIKILGHLQQ